MAEGRRLGSAAEPWERLGVRGWIGLIVLIAALAWTGWYFFIRHEVPGLAEARDRWRSTGPASYELDYTVGAQVSVPVSVVVVDGQVVGFDLPDEYAEADGLGPWSIDEMFDVVDDRSTVTAEFDATLGHPVRASFDPDEGADDDEWRIRVVSLRPLVEPAAG
ncbi:MAG: DUF6174 domain-containing protein [Actinomycetota bacterium]